MTPTQALRESHTGKARGTKLTQTLSSGELVKLAKSSEGSCRFGGGERMRFQWDGTGQKFRPTVRKVQI